MGIFSRNRNYHTKSADQELKIKISLRKYLRESTLPSRKHVKTKLGLILPMLISNGKTSGWVVMYVFGMVILCILLSSPLILIPQHNVLRFPEYWYEPFVTINMSYSLAISLKTMLDCKIILKLDSFMSLKFFIKFYAIIVSLIAVPGFLYQLVWATIVDYEFPTPLTGFIGYIAFYISQTLIWCLMTHEERNREGAGKRYRAYILFKFFTSFVIDAQKNVIAMGIKKTVFEYQWIFAFILPLIRELNTFLLNKILQKLGKLEDIESKVAVTIQVNINHATFIAVQLGTSASQTTAYCILGIDFLINIWSSFKIVKVYRKSTQIQDADIRKRNKEKLKTELLILSLVELIEVLVPLAHLSVTVIAYNGPNFGIIGNIGSSLWQFKKIENIYNLFFVAQEMFVVDLMSAIVAGVIFWKFCSINFLSEIFCAASKYGYLMSLQLAVALAAVRLR